MAWTKVPFTAHNTVIEASFLNGFQDDVIAEFAKSVKVDEAQSFSNAEKTQGRANLGAASQADVIAAAGTIVVTVNLAANTSSQSFTPTHDANIAKLTTNHIVGPTDFILSNSGAMAANWSVNTDSAPTSITITGTPSAATQITLFFRLKQ